MRSCFAGLLLLGAACATPPNAHEAMGPCARARLAREFPQSPTWAGCYGVVAGPQELQGAQMVMLTTIAEDVLADEPPRYRLATLYAFVSATTTSWEQLSPTQARLLWLNDAGGGVEMCLHAEGERLRGHIVVVTDAAPFVQVAAPVLLSKQPCPS